MALHPDFPASPHAIMDPALRWFPADETMRETSMDKLMPPLVAQLRIQVQAWRTQRYAGATATSRSLLQHWFGAPHLLPAADGTLTEFQYYFCQREALETIIYLYDVVGAKDKFDLMRFDSSGLVSANMFDETWRRFVVKMATGSGKTKVLALALAWSFFHKLYEPDSTLARNFLVIAPNIIVLDRIYKDFQGLRIFLKDDPILPDNGTDGRNWRDDFQLTLHVQDAVRITRPTGNIFLTNIHRVYAGDDIPAAASDDDTTDYFLGARPSGATTDSKVDLGMIVRDIDELMVLNDEAHHIHDPRMAWFKSIEDIHNRLRQKGTGLALQLFGAGREKRIYAIPPYTPVRSLDFEDHPFEVQRWVHACALCGATQSFLDEMIVDDQGGRLFVCSDSDYCEQRHEAGHVGTQEAVTLTNVLAAQDVGGGA